MRKLSANKVWALGGLAVGVVIADTINDGWGAIALLVVGLFGKWLLSRIASTFFDDEVQQIKGILKDPIKISIWNHTLDRHEGNWKTCTEPECHNVKLQA